MFGVASPFKDSIFKILDYEKQIYAVANLRELNVVRAKRDKDRVIYKEEVTIGAPIEVIVYKSPIGGVTKYKVKWEASSRGTLEIGPDTIEGIVARLKQEGLVERRHLVDDVIAAIMEGFIRKGRAIMKERIESRGFYLVDGKVLVVEFNAEKPSIEELKEALELLNELAEWYRHIQDKFATVIKWGVVASFNYILKQKGKWLKWLYLYGVSGTGKTTLGEIALAVWGIG